MKGEIPMELLEVFQNKTSKSRPVVALHRYSWNPTMMRQILVKGGIIID
jgi:mRNA-degrading endonuclease toxin of MazEF toxin-antitoxin module